MAQLTVRAGHDLVERVRTAATAAGRSMNEYVVAVLEAATDPDLAGNEAERLRARLARAGLLATIPRRRGRRPSPEAMAAAGDRAGSGTALSDIVSRQR